MAYNYPENSTLRKIIENIKDTQYKVAFMYQFLIGGRAVEVAGNKKPVGIDAKKVNVELDGKIYEAVLFKIKSAKRKMPIRYSLLPLDESIEPWTKIVYEYFKRHNDDETPFKLTKKKMKYNKTYFMNRAKKYFKEYNWLFSKYYRSNREGKSGRIDERPSGKFTSDAIWKMRKLNLKQEYGFDEVDLARFGSWNEKTNDLSLLEIQKLLNEDLTKYERNEIIERAKPYFRKFINYGKTNIKVDLETEYKKIDDLWSKTINEKDSNKKGKYLESLIHELIKVDYELQKGLEKVEVNRRNDSEEFDIILFTSSNRWINMLSQVIVLECKNWTSKVGSDEIKKLVMKLQNRPSVFKKVGFMIAISGFTRGTKIELIGYRGQNFVIGTISGQEIEQLIKNRYLLSTLLIKSFNDALWR